MDNELIDHIANDLNIYQGNGETGDDWRRRVLYSFIGLSILTATYDYDDNIDIDKSLECTISMQHIFNRANELANIFGTGYDESFIKNIREIYIKTGYMLHQANRLTYPPSRYALVKDIFLTRGQLPWTVNYMSGLGTFTNNIGKEDLISWDEMFCVEKKDLAHWYDQFNNSLNWRDIEHLPEDVEYANIAKKPSVGYWLNQLPQNHTTIYRDQRNYGRKYYIIRAANPYAICPLPDWRVNNQEYLRIVLALRLLAGQIPTVIIHQDGPISTIKTGYLLPPPEQNLYELYSWPNSDNSCWNRVVSNHVLPLLKKMFARMGFIINEE